MYVLPFVGHSEVDAETVRDNQVKFFALFGGGLFASTDGKDDQFSKVSRRKGVKPSSFRLLSYRLVEFC